MQSNQASEDRLLRAIQELRTKIAELREHKLSIGEQDTKGVLIEPLIEAIGWDCRNVFDVQREYRSKSADNPVDYALMVDGKPQLFIEAKQWHTNLAEPRCVNQTVSYAAVCGVKWCVLTDGEEYRIYNSHAPVDAEQKLFRVVRITDEAATPETLNTLHLLSKTSIKTDELSKVWDMLFVERQVSDVLKALLAAPPHNLVSLVAKHCREVTPRQVRDCLSRAEVQIAFRPAGSAPPAIAAPQKTRTPEATRYIVIQGERRDCTVAKDIFVQTAEWLVEQGKLTADKCPVILRLEGRTQLAILKKPHMPHRFHVNSEPKHSDGRSFIAPKQLSNGLWVETDLDRSGLEEHARRLLKWAGYDPGILKVHWS